MYELYVQPPLASSGIPHPSRWEHVDGGRSVSSYKYSDEGERVPMYYVGYINSSCVTDKHKYFTLHDAIDAVEKVVSYCTIPWRKL